MKSVGRRVVFDQAQPHTTPKRAADAPLTLDDLATPGPQVAAAQRTPASALFGESTASTSMFTNPSAIFPATSQQQQPVRSDNPVSRPSVLSQQQPIVVPAGYGVSSTAASKQDQYLPTFFFGVDRVLILLLFQDIL